MKFRRAMLFVCVLLLATAGASAPVGLREFHPPKPAPSLELSDPNGRLHSLKDYRGRTVIVNFWATWCRPCREEMPSLKRAWEHLQDQGVGLLAVAIQDSEADVRAFSKEYRTTFPLLLDEQGLVSSRWAVLGVPTGFVVDPQGRVRIRIVGGYEWDDPVLLKKILELGGGVVDVSD